MNPLALLGWQRYVVYGVVIALVLALAELDGYRRGEKKLWEYQADQAKAAVVIVTKQGAVTEKVVTRYIKVREATQTIANGIKNEVIKYVETNPGYCLDRQWGRLHDAAALDAIPEPAIATDGASGAPTASAAIETVSENYGRCHAAIERLDALQGWVREQQAVK